MAALPSSGNMVPWVPKLVTFRSLTPKLCNKPILGVGSRGGGEEFYEEVGSM